MYQIAGYMNIRGEIALECPENGLGGVASGFCGLAACQGRLE